MELAAMIEKISGSIMLSWGIKRFLIALLAGAFANLALPPFDFFGALFISFPVLVWLIDGASDRPDKGYVARRMPAFFTGWSFGFGYFTGGLWWLANAVIASGDEALWALPLAIFALPALLAIFYGFAAAFSRILWSNGIGRIFALAACFGAFEYLRATLFTGFPWNTIGYAGMPIPIAMQSAEVIGIFGVSIITVFIASVPALFATKHGLKAGLICASIMLCAHIGYGAVSLSLTEDQKTSHTVRLVQPSIDQAEKWDDKKRDEIFDTYLRLSSEVPKEGNERPSVIIWPETAAPFILTKTPVALSKIADTLKIGQVLITGAVRLEENSGGQDNKYFNTIYVINDEGQIINSSDKVHLVPFGEYLPFEDLARRIGLAPLAETFGGFTAADQRKILDVPNGLRLLPLICYEVIFPQYVDHAAYNVDAIINVTNDAWYGKTPGPYQHLRQAQLRSVESGLPLIRAGNNGLSVMTDNRGRIISGMDLNYIGISDTVLTTRRISFWDNISRNIALLMLVLFFVIISVANRTKN